MSVVQGEDIAILNSCYGTFPQGRGTESRLTPSGVGGAIHILGNKAFQAEGTGVTFETTLPFNIDVMAINFPLCIVFAASHNFSHVVHSFHLTHFFV